MARLFSAAEAAGWDVAREELKVHELFEADGVWLSSSIRFTRVHTLDGKGVAPRSRPRRAGRPLRRQLAGVAPHGAQRRRCMQTTSSHRPNLRPTSRSVPIISNPHDCMQCDGGVIVPAECGP